MEVNSRSDTNQVRPAQDDKKSAFLVIFSLTLFENTLKYPYVSQKANINRQQAKYIAEKRTNRPTPIEQKAHD